MDAVSFQIADDNGQAQAGSLSPKVTRLGPCVGRSIGQHGAYGEKC